MKFKKKIYYRKILSSLLQQNGSPLFNAKGIAIGVFTGCFPFFGLQTLLGLFLAKIAKGNLFLAALGTWISNPITYIPLYYFNYKVGSFFIKNNSYVQLKQNMVINDLWQQGKIFSISLILGSTIVGFISALICGFIAFLIYKVYEKNSNV